MADFVQSHSQDWLDYFVRQGFTAVEPLAAGVEGAVYRLGSGQVAKVWGHRSVGELQRMQDFYADVARADLTFDTPEILRVEAVGNTVVTFERELRGTPLQASLGFEDRAIGEAAVACIVEVLDGLRTIRGTDAMRQMTVLGEDRPLWDDASTFSAALVGLLDRRVRKFGDLLRMHVDDFDSLFEDLRVAITSMETMLPTVIHGDLFGENILVDDGPRPTAVLDFGFLSTAGDPRLDAATTAIITNMYGPHGAAISAALTDQIATALSYEPIAMLVYQAAYAIATSNAFTSDGTDGHFAWCIRQMTRPDVTAALKLS